MENSNNSSISKEKKEEFKYEYNEAEDNDDEYEKTLEKDIEKNCDLNVYVNKLELVEKSDEELLQMEKHEIIDFKNYQIQKLKAFIISLEKEKEDMIENFKTTTNVLIDKIKEMEFKESGFRPETPFIAKKLKTTGITGVNKYTEVNSSSNSLSNRNKINTMNIPIIGGKTVDKEESKLDSYGDFDIDFENTESKVKRCPQCTKEFPSEVFLQHSLDCLRNKIRCKKCNELIDEKFKKEHLLEWRTKEVNCYLKIIFNFRKLFLL